MAFERPDRSIDRFDDEPTRSFTLAADQYVDPAVFARERQAIFHRSWQYVGHVGELAEPGDYLTAEIADQRIFVVRTDAGELRSFFNVCLHRGHSLLEGSGTIGRRITCPYHAWAYDPDGTLVGARMADRMPDFDFEDYRLPEVAVDQLGGFVFVNLDPDPTPIADAYPGAADALAEIYGDTTGLQKTSVSVFEIAGNWKNIADNLLECYHCHPAHRGFVDLIDMDTYRNDTHDGWSIQSGSYADGNETYEIAGGRRSFTSLYLWPNVSLGHVPGVRGVFVFHIMPTATEQSQQTFSLFTPDGEMSDDEVKAMDFFNDELGPEDVALVENVQVGLRSLGYHQGRFICIPDRPEISEHAVHHFHRMVRNALAGP